MRFSNVKQILGITIAWAVVLFVVDYIKNPRAASEVFGTKVTDAAHANKPHLTIWMNHLCCSGCVGDVQQALAALPGLGRADVPTPDQLKSSAQVDQLPPGETSYANHVELDVTDVKLLDFVAIDHALEATGLVPDRVDFSGVRHFRIEAELKHICCQACTRGLETGLGIAKALRATGQFGWIDSVTVNKERRTIVAHARYDKTVDVEEFLTALHHIGFAPASVRVLVGSET